MRKQSFETFYYTHHLFIPFLLAMYTHATGCFVRDSAEPYSPFAGKGFWTHCIGYEGWRWELFAGGLYLCERIYRELRSRRPTDVLRVIRHPFGAHPQLHPRAKLTDQTRSRSRWKSRRSRTARASGSSSTARPSPPRSGTPSPSPRAPSTPTSSVHIRMLGDGFTRDLGDALGAGPPRPSSTTRPRPQRHVRGRARGPASACRALRLDGALRRARRGRLRQLEGGRAHRHGHRRDAVRQRAEAGVAPAAATARGRA